MGTVQFYNGKVLFVDGRVAMHANCCCGCPAIGADATQPSAVVSVAALPEEECFQDEGDCDAAGIYVFISYEKTPSFCHWLWSLRYGEEFSWDLDVWYCIEEEVFCAVIRGHGGAFGYVAECPCGIGWATDVTVDISVVDGILTGEFGFDGDQSCIGCTATVTLG